MKKKLFYILSTVTLVVITSGISGSFGYKMGKQEGVYEKDAAVKGVEYDIKDKLAKEALTQADLKTDSTESKGGKTIKSFYADLGEEKYEEAWALLTEDYQKKLRTVNSFKYSYQNIKSLTVKDVEFRTSSLSSEVYAVTLDMTYVSPNSTQKDGEKSFYINVVDSDNNWLIDEISEK